MSPTGAKQLEPPGRTAAARRALADSVALGVAVVVAVFVAVLGGAACSKDVVEALVLGPCRADPGGPGCPPLVWPNDVSMANSDPWLVEHHDELVAIEPRVLLLDFYDGQPSAQLPVLSVDDVNAIAQQQIAALALGSRFHGYSDASAPAFVNYKIVATIDLTDHPGPPAGWNYPSSTLLPTTPDGTFDPTALFTQAFGDRFQFADPTQPSRNLTLCELFEQGAVNEVWLAIGEAPPRGIDSLERKQIYDATYDRLSGQFEPCAGGHGNCLTGIECGVTVRMTHLSPLRGLGCDLDIRGWTMEAEAILNTVPYLATNGLGFFNRDFEKRFGTPFNGWDDICDASTDTAPCLSYASPTVVSGLDASGATQWTINPFLQGCGTTDFPPNARYRDDYVDTTAVQSRCEHYDMGDGAAGADAASLYTSDTSAGYVTQINALTAQLTNLQNPLPDGNDCGGGWQLYLRQSIPGFRNNAYDNNGLPMKNWWPFLFY